MHTDPECCEVFKGDKLPERQLKRLLSVRAYDGGDMTRGTEIVRDDGDGVVFERVVGVSFFLPSNDACCGVLTRGQGMLRDEQVKWVGVYNAGPGCFCVRVERGE